MTDDWDDLDALLAPPDPPDYGEPPDGQSLGAIVEPPPGQVGLFGEDDKLKPAYQEWGGMPEFRQLDLTPDSSIIVNFASPADRKKFFDLIGQSQYQRLASRSVWYPALEIASYADKRYIDKRTERERGA